MAKGFTFDGVHSDILGILLRGKNIPILPPMEEHFEPIAGRDGVWDFGIQYGARPIELDVVLLADSVDDLNSKVRAIASLFNPRKGARPLVMDDEQDVQYLARLTGQLPIDQLASFGTFTIQLICTDPFRYGLNEVVREGTTSLTLTHLGNHKAYPRLEITHGGGNGTLTLHRSDNVTQVMTFKASSPSGVYIIDGKEGTITLNGGPAYKHVTGDFMELPEGSNTLNIGGNITKAVVRFNHTWL